MIRELVPQVLGVLVRRGADFAAAEDAVQDALTEAVRRWGDKPFDDDGAAATRPGEPRPGGVPRSRVSASDQGGPEAGPPVDLKGWLITVSWRKFLDARRSASARALREVRVALEPSPGPAGQGDDTLLILSRCCHRSLTPASAIALTLRAVGGLTTAQIARAFLVPEATMAQRISRAKRTVSGQDFGGPGDVHAVLRVLYLMFNEGFTSGGEVDLSAEAIRLARGLIAVVPEDPEAAGLLALMLLHHARRAARSDDDGALVPLDQQDRARWDTAMIAEGVGILTRALERDRLGEYQAQAAIAALHDDAATAAETDWPQILSWYDELLALVPDNPVATLNRTIAVGHAQGARAGLRALEPLAPGLPRRDAAEAYLWEMAGDGVAAAKLYARAADVAQSAPERTHLLKRAAVLGKPLP